MIPRSAGGSGRAAYLQPCRQVFVFNSKLNGKRGRACGMYVLKGSFWLFYVRTNIEEATAVVQVRVAQGARITGAGGKATGVGEKGLDLGYVLKMEMPGFAEGLQVV